MKYFIAYKDNNGNDFNGQPWLTPEGGTEDLLFAKAIKQDFIKRGFKDVKIFECDEYLEEIDWEFVEDNEV